MGGLAVRLSKVTERQRYSGWVLDLWGRQDGIRWNSERRVSDVVTSAILVLLAGFIAARSSKVGGMCLLGALAADWRRFPKVSAN